MQKEADGHISINELNKSTKEIRAMQNKLIQAVKNELVEVKKKGVKNLDLAKIGVIRSDATNKIKDTDLGKLIDEANHLIAEAKGSEIPRIVGEAGEGVVAAATYMAGNYGAKVTQQLLRDNLIVGKNRQQTVLQGFSSYVDLSQLERQFNNSYLEHGKKLWEHDTQSDTLIYTNGSQGTVDISIPLNPASDFAKDLGINEINASVKNYNDIDAHGIGAISGVPLLSIFMLINTNFVNHYLNLLGASGPPNLRDSLVAQRATGVIKHAVVARALTGARSKTYADKTADCLVVNNRKEKKVYVLSTYDLLRTIRSNYEKYASFEGIPTRLDNRWVGGEFGPAGNFWAPSEDAASTRITNLIAETHKFKIKMSLRPNTIREAAAKRK